MRDGDQGDLTRVRFDPCLGRHGRNHVRHVTRDVRPGRRRQMARFESMGVSLDWFDQLDRLIG